MMCRGSEAARGRIGSACPRAPAVADLPAGGIRLDPRAVPVLSFTGAPTGDDTKLEGTHAAVAQLGGKADAARLVAIVEPSWHGRAATEVVVAAAVVIAAQARR